MESVGPKLIFNETSPTRMLGAKFSMHRNKAPRGKTFDLTYRRQCLLLRTELFGQICYCKRDGCCREKTKSGGKDSKLSGSEFGQRQTGDYGEGEEVNVASSVAHKLRFTR